MKCAKIFAAGLASILTLNATRIANGAIVVIEPDNYTEGTALTKIAPGITLQTMTDATNIVPLFTVTADTRAGLASTGTKVFGHADVPFWLDFRRLRVDFASPVQIVSIDAIGGTNFSSDYGRLEAYNAAGTLLQTYNSSPLPKGTAETMTIFRTTPDISYVSAYSTQIPEGAGSFMSLDHLVVNSIPEPMIAGIAALSFAGLATARHRRRAR